MIIDVDPGNKYFITVFEEENESFINLQKVSSFSFCPEMDLGKYRIPLVALPALKNAMCKIRYSFQYTPKLKEVLAVYSKERNILEQSKNTFQDEAIRQDIIDTVKLPAGFQLAETQLITIGFALLGKRILIGNEIGDGKTLSANGLATYLINKRRVDKVVVITSAPLVDNYVKDYIKFFGEKGIITTFKQDKAEREHTYKMFGTPNNGIHFLVTNYEKCKLDYYFLKKCKPDIVIVDEFHKIRNFISAQRSQSFFDLIKAWNPEYRIPMTGTPIENRLFDLYPVFKFLNDGLTFGSQDFFERNFIKFEDMYFKVTTKSGRVFTKFERKPVGFKHHDFLKSIIRPLVIRKKTKLPVEMTEHFAMLEMSKPIRLGYASIEQNWHSFRQYLNNPTRGGCKDNPKVDSLLEILEQTDSKTVIFSFYKDTIRMLSGVFNDRNIKHHVVTGDSGGNVFEMIEEFKNDADAKVMLCTDRIQDGVNIQFAQNVINYEMPLKPTAYRQRNGRVYRRGQTKDVRVYNFIYKDTVEEGIYNMVEAKKEIIQKVLEELDDSEVERKLQAIDEMFLSEMVKKYGIKLDKEMAI